MHTFPTPQPVSAIVDVVTGLLRVVAEDRDDTTVDVRPRDPSRGSDVRAAERAKVEFHNGTLKVEAGPKIIALGRAGAVQVDISLPTRSRLQASSAYADVFVDGVLSECRFASASGDVHLDEVAGDVKVDTSSGDITVRSVVGNATVNTASGDTRIDVLDGDLSLTTASGDLTLGRLNGDVKTQLASGSATLATAVSGSLTVQTGSGDVSLGIAERTAARLDVSTRTGALSNTLTTVAGPDDGDATFIAYARTRTGDITIRRAPESAKATR